MLSAGHITIHTIGLHSQKIKFLNFFGDVEEFSYTKSKLYTNLKEAEYKLRILQKIGAVSLRILSYRVEPRHVYINSCAELFYQYLGYYRDLTEKEYQSMNNLYYNDKKREDFVNMYKELVNP